MYTYNYTITKEDCINISKESELQGIGFFGVLHKSTRCFAIFEIILLGFFVLYLLSIASVFDMQKGYVLFFLVLVCLSVFILCIFLLQMFFIYKKLVGTVVTVSINETGITINNIVYEWDKISDIYVTRHVLFLILKLKNCTIPKRVFNSEDELNEVYKFIKSKVEKE